MKRDEELVATTNTFRFGSSGALVVVVPKTVEERLKLKNKTHFKVLVDRSGNRIIYERIE